MSTVEFINKEISLVFDSASDGVQILGSDTNNKSAFQVNFDEPVYLPAEVIDCTLQVDEVIVSNVSPNITEDSDFIYNGVTYTIPIGLWSIDELQGEMNSLISPFDANNIRLTGINAIGKVRISNIFSLSFPGGLSNQLVVLLGLSASQTTIAPGSITQGDNVARFDVLDSYVVVSDLVSNGIRYSNDYRQVIAQVHITIGSGGLIVFSPVQPAIIPTPELLGTTKSRVILRLLKNNLEPADTRGTNWSVRVRIKWKEMRMLDVANIKPTRHHA